MKYLLQLPLLCFFILNNIFAQEHKSTYIFGHSLIVHDPPINPTLSNETTVPHWLHFLAEDANNSIEVSGQYGFLTTHENRVLNSTVFAQWNFDHVAQAWDSDNEDFSAANFDTVLLTAANFIQYKPSNENYDGPSSYTTPLAATLTILDWVNEQEPEAVKYIYENWPNMNGFILTEDGEFPPSQTEFANYHNVTLGSFHNWWLDYHDFISSERPNQNIKMIPVGPIISKLLTQTPLSGIPVETLYEDKAPHGRPTIYFLASLITYMAIYEEKIPATYTIPTNDVNNPVSPLIQENYQDTIDFIWSELLAFNYDNGESRVFSNSVLNINEIGNNTNDYLIYPNPVEDNLSLKNIESLGISKIEIYDLTGRLIANRYAQDTLSFDVSELSNGTYILKGINTLNKQMYTGKFSKK